MAQLGDATENSTYETIVSLTDETGAAVVPTSLVWSLRDDTGAIVNSRNQVVATCASAISVLLGAADLAYEKKTSTKRYITYEGVYASSLGSGLPIVAEDWFNIINITGLNWETGEDIDIEQKPGIRNMKLVAGDDFEPVFRMNFAASGYTFTTTVNLRNQGDVSIPTSSVVSTGLTSIQAYFQASITSLFTSTSADRKHSWKMKYASNASKVRTFIVGDLEVS